MINYHLEHQYFCVLRHQKLSISPGVLVYFTNHSERYGWYRNEEKHRGFIKVELTVNAPQIDYTVMNIK